MSPGKHGIKLRPIEIYSSDNNPIIPIRIGQPFAIGEAGGGRMNDHCVERVDLRVYEVFPTAEYLRAKLGGDCFRRRPIRGEFRAAAEDDDVVRAVGGVERRRRDIRGGGYRRDRLALYNNNCD